MKRAFIKLRHNPHNQGIYLIVLITSFFLHVLIITKARLLVEEAYYWNYAQHLDWSYLDHPPMVALLIKLMTLLFGNKEFGVRISSGICWFISTYFTYQLSEAIRADSGRYAVLLMSSLPFFFIQSIVITPDVFLITCWSACLYYLYCALILDEEQSWYWVGLWLGFGFLSKYTIGLIVLATLIYVLSQSKARHWLRRKEPYGAVLISIFLFAPVLYWNAHHEWISFIFQTSRRIRLNNSFNLHYVLGLTLFFITPLGVTGLWHLIKKNALTTEISADSRTFMRYFTFIPLGFFSLYSLNHEVNFNWIGPIFLALIPLLASLMLLSIQQRTCWFLTAAGLMMVYLSVLLVISFNQSEKIQQTLLIKVISWDDLVKKLHFLAATYEEQNHKTVAFVPLDKYQIGSELVFYQTKLLAEREIKKSYPIIGAHIFNRESLMYRFWSQDENLSGRILILLSKEAWRFDDPEIIKRVNNLSTLGQVWSVGQGHNIKNIPYYYKIVEFKTI